MLAGVHELVGHLGLHARGRLLERDLDLHRLVAALDTAGPAPERPSEGIAAEEGVEDVGKRAEPVGLGGKAARVETLEAVAVIGGAAVGVSKDLVGLGGLLELLLGLGIVAVDVRVQLAGEAPERLLDLAVVGVASDAQHVVGVAPHSSYTSATKRDSSPAAWRTAMIACG